MPDESNTGAVISIGGVRISGVAAPGQARALRDTLASGLETQLAASTISRDNLSRIELPHVRIRLPHGAGSQEIARALSQAIAQGVRGKRP